MKAIKIGVIAEEKNDVEVLYKFTCKLKKENRFSFSNFLGHGCGKLQKKCRAWAENFQARGISALVVLHDLDRADEQVLRASLDGQIKNIRIKSSIILIPIEELEAWLICDAKAIRKVFNMKSDPQVPINPERINDPKNWLAKLVKRMAKKQYLNTVHNSRIAEHMSIAQLKKRCPSFRPYPNFVEKILP